jgi:small ligand-binding sensory domain FIST
MKLDLSLDFKWANGVSTKVSLEAAVKEVCRKVNDELAGRSPDFGVIFIANSFASEYSRLMPLLTEQIEIKHLIGCSGGGIVGDGQELEDMPALSLMVGHIPNAGIKTFHIIDEQLPDLDSSPDRWQDLIGVSAYEEEANFVILADPFSFAVSDFLRGLDFAYPHAVKVGGMASSNGVGTNALFCSVVEGQHNIYRSGAVGAAIWGDIVIDAVVAQGCRPIGKPLQISECDRNIILSLEDQSPLVALQNIVNDLSQSDRDLAQHSLFVGVVMNEFKPILEQGDFLIRNIIGVDPRSGAIAVADRMRPGQRIQLHLRDRQASAEDLEGALIRYQREHEVDQACAGLMFACMGRGEGLYGKTGFDSQLFRSYLGDVPLSGFFCGGEIGPVSGSTFVHGYTSSFGIFRSRSQVK